MKTALLVLALGMAPAAGAAAPDADAAQLIQQINALRRAAAACPQGARAPVPALTPQPLLGRVRLQAGTILIAALDSAGYDAEVADAVQVAGPADVDAALAALREHYCATLTSTRYRDIGAHRNGNEWTVVLARAAPDPASVLPALDDAGQQVLAASNAARAQGQRCGEQWMAPAPPLSWQAGLAAAALAHSRDMALKGYFSHQGRDGSDAGERALAAGYRWRAIGENIAHGQLSAEEVVAGWLSSPGHCSNLMNPRFSEMGAAYAVRSGKRPAAYWTQVLAAPR